MVHDFSSAMKACLEFLRQQFGFDLGMVTRTEGDDWIVLAVEDRHYDVKAGSYSAGPIPFTRAWSRDWGEADKKMYAEKKASSPE